MSGLGTVYKKEVRENLRDRRSLFNSVLLGPILFPVLFIGLAYFASSNGTRTQPGQFFGAAGCHHPGST